jgi:hypothetical protein
METMPLLETYLRELRLPTILRNYHQVAQDAATAQLVLQRHLRKQRFKIPEPDAVFQAK